MFSGVLALAGAALYITDRIHAPYVFAAGAAGITVCFMTVVPPKDSGFRRRRLHRINVLAGISMIASSIFMFRERMEWVVFLLIAALLMIYTSSVTPRADE
jgi:hypothetical protein